MFLQIGYGTVRVDILLPVCFFFALSNKQKNYNLQMYYFSLYAQHTLERVGFREFLV